MFPKGNQKQFELAGLVLNFKYYVNDQQGTVFIPVMSQFHKSLLLKAWFGNLSQNCKSMITRKQRLISK